MFLSRITIRKLHSHFEYKVVLHKLAGILCIHYMLSSIYTSIQNRENCIYFHQPLEHTVLQHQLQSIINIQLKLQNYGSDDLIEGATYGHIYL